MNSFKLDDWVRVMEGHAKNKIFKVTGLLGTDVLLGNCFNYKADHCELWQPKVGEWCWFINDNCAPLLAQFVKMQDQSFWINNEYKSVLGYKANKFGHYSGNIGPKDEDYVFVYCEPFIGQLPTHLKDLS